MCGIVGYVGRKPVVPVLLDGLRLLEYRGYDSAGLAFLDDDNLIQVYKASGKLLNLENILAKGNFALNTEKTAEKNPETPPTKQTKPAALHVGIGHIRWATHGGATDANAHPHVSQNLEIALAHNGIIENYFEIQQVLKTKGYRFVSETDTECIAHLLEDLLKQSDLQQPHPDPLLAKEREIIAEKTLSSHDEGRLPFLGVMIQALQQLKGAYALTVISRHQPDHLYAVRNHAPLVIGVGQGEMWVASDAVAMAQYTNRMIFLKDRQIAELTPEGVCVFAEDGTPLEPVIETVSLDPFQIDKKGFKHFMLKEIYEQPDVIRNSLVGRLLAPDQPVDLLPIIRANLAKSSLANGSLTDILVQARRMIIIGCGTSYHAAMVGKYFIEDWVRIPVEVESAGEFRYRRPIVDGQTLVVALSQSGETADTLEAVRQTQLLGAQQGLKVIAITNREDSTLAREADVILPVRAGVEVSVCATKTFLAQMTVLYLLGIAMREARSASANPVAADTQLLDLKAELFKIPTLIEAILSQTEPIQAMAKQYGHTRDVLFMARGVNYPVALEGALKLKEISYIHAEGYSGSELKHGPIAMLDESIAVVSVLVQGPLFEKMISNCQEAKARNARVLAITNTPEALPENLFESVLSVPESSEWASPFLTTIPLQLLAYYMAEYLGKDVDQPRNLAKSVTVE